MMKAFITVGSHTINHAAVLRKAGYTVTESDGKYWIDCEGVVETLQDVSTPEKCKAALAELLKAKKLWSYKTPFHFEGGKVKSSIMACTALGVLSAFIAKVPKTIKLGGADYGDLLDSLLAPEEAKAS